MSIHHPQRLSAAFVADHRGNYGLTRPVTADEIVEAGNALISQRFLNRDKLRDAQAAKQLFRTQLAELGHDLLCVLFLSTKLHILCCETMCRGTIDQASVYPREVVLSDNYLCRSTTINSAGF